MELNDALYMRRAVRDFTPAAVDQATVTALIDAAIQAPSAMDEQPWSFVVVRDKALLDRISTEAKAWMLKSTPAGLLSHHFQETLGNPNFQIFYHAPALIVIAGKSEGPWTVIDCALAAQNLMLAARASGLGTCWIGFAQGWLNTAEGKAALQLPAGTVPVAPIIVGQPKAWPQAHKKNEAEIQWIG